MNPTREVVWVGSKYKYSVSFSDGWFFVSESCVAVGLQGLELLSYCYHWRHEHGYGVVTLIENFLSVCYLLWEDLSTIIVFEQFWVEYSLSLFTWVPMSISHQRVTVTTDACVLTLRVHEDVVVVEDQWLYLVREKQFNSCSSVFVFLNKWYRNTSVLNSFYCR